MVRPAPFDVRVRTPGDLDSCVALAEEVHAEDGYPSFVGDSGLAVFIDPDDAICAWVATIDQRVVGMVALRPHSAPQSAAIAARELGVDEDRLGFVARLEVAPGARRRGIGLALLDAAVDEARRRDRVPVLDVVTRDASAVAMYDASGWRRLGGHELELRDGRRLDIAVYAAP
jgi:ribosomal protein S18 acetylase RimI-like enzyme